MRIGIFYPDGQKSLESSGKTFKPAVTEVN